MTRIQPDSRCDRKPKYVAPSLTAIGHASEVILGVSAIGEDFMGYSEPDFEFEADEPFDGRNGGVAISMRSLP